MQGTGYSIMSLSPEVRRKPTSLTRISSGDVLRRARRRVITFIPQNDITLEGHTCLLTFLAARLSLAQHGLLRLSQHLLQFPLLLPPPNVSGSPPQLTPLKVTLRVLRAPSPSSFPRWSTRSSSRLSVALVVPTTTISQQAPVLRSPVSSRSSPARPFSSSAQPVVSVRAPCPPQRVARATVTAVPPTCPPPSPQASCSASTLFGRRTPA